MALAASADHSVQTERYRCDDPMSYAGVGQGQRPHFIRQLLPYRQFKSIARRLPDKTAFVAPDRTLTYAELDTLINDYASGLIALGLHAGEGVAAIGGNRWEQLPQTNPEKVTRSLVREAVERGDLPN